MLKKKKVQFVSKWKCTFWNDHPSQELLETRLQHFWTLFLSPDNEMFVQRLLELTNKEVFSEKSCFKNFAHPLSEGENIKK